MLASRVSIWYGVFLAAEGHRRKKCFGACRSGVESTHVQRARGDAPKAAACDAAGACSSTRRCRDHPHGRRRSVGFARGEPRGERERRHARTPERRVGADRSLGGDSALSAAHACEGGPRVGCGTRQQPKVERGGWQHDTSTLSFEFDGYQSNGFNIRLLLTSRDPPAQGPAAGAENRHFHAI